MSDPGPSPRPERLRGGGWRLGIAALVAVAALGTGLALELRSPPAVALQEDDPIGEVIEGVESGEAPSGWVIPPSASLRAAPEEAAPELAKLERGTALVILQEDAGGWTQVRVYQDPSLEGWLPADSIGSAQDAIPQLR